MVEPCRLDFKVGLGLSMISTISLSEDLGPLKKATKEQKRTLQTVSRGLGRVANENSGLGEATMCLGTV